MSDGAVALRGEPLRIVVVDDHPLFRQGVALTLSMEPDLVVVGQGASAAEAVALAEQLRPHLILLDVTMPGGGLSAIAEIVARSPETAIGMLTVSEDQDDVTAALKAGARGYLLKGVSAAELVEVARSLCAGEGYISPALAAAVLAQLTRGAAGDAGADPGESGPSTTTRADAPMGGAERRPASPARPAVVAVPADPLRELTERELQVLERVAEGDSNKEIAQTLFLSEKTVKHYMTSILQKLQARNRVEAALMARDSARGPR